MQFRAQNSASPTAAGARRGSLALLFPPHKGGSWEKGLASFIVGSHLRHPSSPNLPLLQGPVSSPMGKPCPPTPHVWLHATCRSHPLGDRHSLLSCWGGEVVSGGTCSCVQSSRCATNRGKATSSSWSRPPRPCRSPGRAPAAEDGGLVRAPHQTDPASFLPLPFPHSPPNTLGFFLFCFCFFCCCLLSSSQDPLPLQPGDGFDLGLLQK